MVNLRALPANKNREARALAERALAEQRAKLPVPAQSIVKKNEGSWWNRFKKPAHEQYHIRNGPEGELSLNNLGERP